MSDLKAYFKQQMERVKSTAAQLVPMQDGERVVTLQPEAYERARQWAEEHHTSVEAVVNDMLDRFLPSSQADAARSVTRERQERNPLLLLDGLCEREL